MPTPILQIVEQDLSQGKLWTTRFKSASLAGGAEVLIGIEVQSRPVIYMNRIYTSDCSEVEVRLYETTYTGGTELGVRNRNFTTGGNPPVIHKSGVTANLAGLTEVAGLDLVSTSGAGNSQIGVLPEGEWYILESNKQYVLSLKNTGSTAGYIAFRYTLKSE